MYINRTERVAPEPKSETKRVAKKNKDSSSPSFEDAIDTILSAEAIEVVTDVDDKEKNKRDGKQKKEADSLPAPPHGKLDYTA